jgi:hypothetical protein
MIAKATTLKFCHLKPLYGYTENNFSLLSAPRKQGITHIENGLCQPKAAKTVRNRRFLVFASISGKNLEGCGGGVGANSNFIPGWWVKVGDDGGCGGKWGSERQICV